MEPFQWRTFTNRVDVYPLGRDNLKFCVYNSAFRQKNCTQTKFCAVVWFIQFVFSLLFSLFVEMAALMEDQDEKLKLVKQREKILNRNTKR